MTLFTNHSIFSKRCLSPPKDQLIDGYEYCNLIALYNRVLLPLPQRKYGNSRKCKELAVKQIDCDKQSALKRKFDESNDTNNNFTKLKIRPEITSNLSAQQVFNQRHDSKRQKILWP